VVISSRKLEAKIRRGIWNTYSIGFYTSFNTFIVMFKKINKLRNHFKVTKKKKIKREKACQCNGPPLAVILLKCSKVRMGAFIPPSGSLL
jgi:hypothetical protein